ncbi:serine/arginine repetitive matrix protein 1-like [Brassica napus]|uniref:serine/arginine repetitive matrix protein 1-like n=1 Tax=Brassica napus TaxID=3708 RepID=UPI002078CCD7|nr:serine/arginine repetitive matrix protein 1-like [Brassica napus]
MENRRLTAAEKGKGMVSEPYQAPRKARVRAPEPANSYLLQKHSLTLIGRVTNLSVQKVWSLLPFFTDRWATETRPVGSDLGQGMFQFQFAREEDLLSVLEKRPYRYAKWMVIVERWNPTTAPDFPSLIPFWIKVQGLPVHLWTEDTVKVIGEDLGVYETADITSLSARIRVQINGRLPLIMESIVEFPNGDEVTATLVYEGLDKHCTYCKRLDHEARECLKAKAEKKEQQSQVEEEKKAHTQSENARGYNDHRPSEYGKSTSLRHRNSERLGPYSRDNRSYSRERHHGVYKPSESTRNTNPRRSEDRNYQWRQISDKRAMERERSSHTSAFRAAQRNNSQPPRFEIPQTTDPSARVGRLPSPPILPRIDREESSASKGGHVSTDRGIPLRLPIDDLPTDAMEEALGEVRGFMNQYASVADPTESAARMERYRQAEELGEFEETAAQMVRAKLASQATPPMERTATPSPKRTSAILRLGPPPPLSKGTSPPDQTAPRRKPGRPPGSKRTVHSSPKLLAGSTSRKRKVQQTKPPTCRRKLTPANTPSAVPRGQKNRPTNSRDSSNRRGSSQNSDDQPLSRMVPAITKKKKTDFHNPSTLVP